jgi:hypothetical protein
MIRKVYEIDPLRCTRCGGAMKVVSFLTEPAVVDRIINHLKLTFVAERPPPPEVAFPFRSSFGRPTFRPSMICSCSRARGERCDRIFGS